MKSATESLRIIDNCLMPEHLEAVRSSFLRNGFGTWTPAVDGILSRKRFQGCGYVGRNDLLLAALHAYLGRPLYPEEMKARRTGEGETDTSHIHADSSMGTHTAIVYLTPKPTPGSGTQFYRYNPNPAFERLENGLEIMPPYEEMIQPGQTITEGEPIRLKPWGEALRTDMENEDPENSPKWRRSFFVDEECNRAVIFPAAMFHCRLPCGGIGVDNETRRLIWVAHFRF